METITKKKQAVDFFIKKDILLSQDILEILNEKDFESIHTLIKDKIKSPSFLLLNKDLTEALKNLSNIDINWFELEKSKALLEKGKDNKIYQQFMKFIYNQKEKIIFIIYNEVF